MKTHKRPISTPFQLVPPYAQNPLSGNGSDCLLRGKPPHSNNSEPPPPKKLEVCLGYFIKRDTRGMNTLEANDLYGDTALHNSVSTLHNKHSICILRKPEQILNRAGTLSRFMPYWIDPEQMNKAKRLHAFFRSQRGLLPLYQIEQEVN